MPKKYASGFTIVELLIVIVVIGILAAITIVAYNGVQDRAHDTAVKSDLTTIAKKIQLYNADNGNYPTNLKPLNTNAANALYSFSIDQDSLATSPQKTANLFYCVDSTTAPTKFLLTFISKSGNDFYIGSDNSLGQYTGTTVWTSPANACGSVSDGWTVAGQYGYNNGGSGGSGTTYSTQWQWW